MNSQRFLITAIASCVLFAHCSLWEDITDRFSGTSEDQAAESVPVSSEGETANDGTPGTPSPTPATPPLPRPDVDIVVPTGHFALLPANPDVVVSLDVRAILSYVEALIGASLTSLIPETATSGMVEEIAREMGIPEQVLREIQPLRAEQVVFAVWIDTESVVMVINQEVFGPEIRLTEALAPLAGLPVQAFAREGLAVVGIGPSIGAAFSMDPGAGFNPAETWPAGWNALPESAAFRMFAPQSSMLMRELLRGVGMGHSTEISRVAFGASLDGSAVAVIDTPDDAFIREPLGALQSAYGSTVLPVRDDLPEAFRPLVDYGEQAMRVIWAHVRLDREGTVTTLRILAPNCPNNLFASTTVISFMVAAYAMVPMGGAIPPGTYENVEVDFSGGCGPHPGPPASLRTDILRALYDLDPNLAAGAVSVDLGSLMRSQLPTFFGLLPGAIPPGELERALGATPLGLDSLRTGDGQIAFVLAETEVFQEDTLVVAYPGFQTLMREPRDADVLREVRDGVGFITGSSELADQLSRSVDATNVWERSAAVIPSGSHAAFIVNETAMREIRSDAPPALAPIFSDMEALVITLNGQLQPEVRALVRGDAPAHAATLEAAILALADAYLESLSVDERVVSEPMIRYMVTHGFSISGADDVVTFALASDGAMAHLHGPLVSGMILGGGVGFFLISNTGGHDAYALEAPSAFAGDNVTSYSQLLAHLAVDAYLYPGVDHEGKDLPNVFPSIPVITPSLDEIRSACALGDYVYLPYDDSASGSMITRSLAGTPLRIGFTIESIGAGPDASATIVAHHDEECTGNFQEARTRITVSANGQTTVSDTVFLVSHP